MNVQQRKAVVELAIISRWKCQILNEAMSLLNDEHYTREAAAKRLLELVADIGESEQVNLAAALKSAEDKC